MLVGEYMSVEVEGERLVEPFGCEFDDGREVATGASIAEEDVELAELLDGSAHYRFDVRLTCHVRTCVNGSFTEALRQRLAFGILDIRNDDPITLSHKRLSAGRPQSTGATGDDRDLAFEFEQTRQNYLLSRADRR